MANKDELLKTINEAFKELTKDVDDQTIDGEGGTKVSFEKYI